MYESEFQPQKNKQKINTIDHNNNNCTNCEVSYWNKKHNCRIRSRDGLLVDNTKTINRSIWRLWSNKKYLGEDKMLQNWNYEARLT